MLVEIPEHNTTVEFPDDTPPEEITRVIDAQFYSSQSTPQRGNSGTFVGTEFTQKLFSPSALDLKASGPIKSPRRESQKLSAMTPEIKARSYNLPTNELDRIRKKKERALTPPIEKVMDVPYQFMAGVTGLDTMAERLSSDRENNKNTPKSIYGDIANAAGNLVGFIATAGAIGPKISKLIPATTKGGVFANWVRMLGRNMVTIPAAASVRNIKGESVGEVITESAKTAAHAVPDAMQWSITPFLNIPSCPNLSKIMRFGANAFISDYRHGTSPGDKRSLPEKLYAYGLDAYFSRHGITKKTLDVRARAEAELRQMNAAINEAQKSRLPDRALVNKINTMFPEEAESSVMYKTEKRKESVLVSSLSDAEQSAEAFKEMTPYEKARYTEKGAAGLRADLKQQERVSKAEKTSLKYGGHKKSYKDLKADFARQQIESPIRDISEKRAGERAREEARIAKEKEPSRTVMFGLGPGQQMYEAAYDAWKKFHEGRKQVMAPEEIEQTKIEKMPFGIRLIDEVKQPVDAALLAQKRGRPEFVKRMAAKARKNAEMLRTAGGGPIIEKLINAQLRRLPKEKEPSRAGTLGFGPRQQIYENAGDAWKKFHEGRKKGKVPREPVVYVGDQENVPGKPPISLINDMTNSTVAYDPDRHVIINMEDYRNRVYVTPERREALQNILRKEFKLRGAGSFIDSSPKEFILQRAKSSRSHFLTPYNEKELDNFTLRTDSKGVGYALIPEKDLVNVFNNSGIRGAGKEAIIDAISKGAKTLDCFDGFFAKYYERFGFKEYKRDKWDDQYAPEGWDYEKNGRPDVVYMRYEGGTRNANEIRESERTFGSRRNRGERGPNRNALPVDSRPGGQTRRRMGQEIKEPSSRRMGSHPRTRPITAPKPIPNPSQGGDRPISKLFESRPETKKISKTYDLGFAGTQELDKISKKICDRAIKSPVKILFWKATRTKNNILAKLGRGDLDEGYKAIKTKGAGDINLVSEQEMAAQMATKEHIKKLDPKSPGDLANAMSIYLEYKDNWRLADKYFNRLNPEQKERYGAIHERAKNLTTQEKAFADTVYERIKENEMAGVRAGVITRLKDSPVTYIPHFLDVRKGQHDYWGARTSGVLDPSTMFGKKRKFRDGIYEAIAEGYDPLTLNIADIVRLHGESVMKAATNKWIIHQLQNLTMEDGRPALSIRKQGTEDYRNIDHRYFTDRVWRSVKSLPGNRRALVKAKKGEKTVGSIAETIPLRVHPDIYPDLKKYLSGSALDRSAVGRFVKKLNYMMKKATLSFSGFHHVALGKTLFFYMPPKTWAKTMVATLIDIPKLAIPKSKSIKGSIRDIGMRGLKAIEQNDPVLQNLLRANMTLGSGGRMDYGRMLGLIYRDNQLRAKGESPIKKAFYKIKDISKLWDEALWDRFYRGSKAMAAKIEFERWSKRYAKELSSGEITQKELYERVARDMNNNFGGLNQMADPRTGKSMSRTGMDVARLVMLAQDWTLSNWRFFGTAARQALRGESKGGAIRYMLKTILMTTIASELINRSLNNGKSMLDNDSKHKHHIKIKINRKTYYLDLLGHFGEWIKATEDPGSWASHKMSQVARMGEELLSRRDWADRFHATFDDLAKGKLTGDRYKQPGFYESLPGYGLTQIRKFIPIPANALLDAAMGDKTSLEALTTLGGVPMRQYRSKKKTYY